MSKYLHFITVSLFLLTSVTIEAKEKNRLPASDLSFDDLPGTTVINNLPFVETKICGKQPEYTAPDTDETRLIICRDSLSNGIIPRLKSANTKIIGIVDCTHANGCAIGKVYFSPAK